MRGVLHKEEIDKILSGAYIMRIGFLDKDRIHILPVTYAYDQSTYSLISHSGPGTKINAMRKNPEVCFEIEEIKSLSKWKTVTGWGSFEELQGADARNGLHTLVNKVRKLVTDEDHPHMKYLSDLSNSTGTGKDFVIYRIRISECMGRFENHSF